MINNSRWGHQRTYSTGNAGNTVKTLLYSNILLKYLLKRIFNPLMLSLKDILYKLLTEE